jgi:GINS complex subunit 4
MQSTTNFRGPFQNPSHSDTIKYLQLIWKNEKLCKDLLPYEDEFLSQLINVIEQKEKEIKNKKHNFDQETLDFMELDLQRVKYFVKDYLRIRLAKIEKYLYYILKNNLASLLSETEAKFVVDLINMKAVYFNEGLKKVVAVANNFRPFYDKYKNIQEKADSLNDAMIVHPPTNAYVIVESITDENIIVNIKEIYQDYEKEYLILEKGDIAVVPYKLMKEFIINKKVKLI